MLGGHFDLGCDTLLAHREGKPEFCCQTGGGEDQQNLEDSPDRLVCDVRLKAAPEFLFGRSRLDHRFMRCAVPFDAVRESPQDATDLFVKPLAFFL